jgi:hypothetical protein
VATFEWLGQRKNERQTLIVLAVGLLLMLAVVFSAMRGEDEDKGKMRTKSLVYENNGNGSIGLYWMDDESNLRKATPEEIRRCKEVYPDEVVPTCQTNYYEKEEDRQ